MNSTLTAPVDGRVPPDATGVILIENPCLIPKNTPSLLVMVKVLKLDELLASVILTVYP